jgi:hypothetical protein
VLLLATVQRVEIYGDENWVNSACVFVLCTAIFFFFFFFHSLNRSAVIELDSDEKLPKVT